MLTVGGTQLAVDGGWLPGTGWRGTEPFRATGRSLDVTGVLKVQAASEVPYCNELTAGLAAAAPSLHAALLAAKMAGYDHVNIDGTLIETDRCRTPGPTPGVDLWWSGKHDNHGGNIQVITAPTTITTPRVAHARTHNPTRLFEG